MKFIHTADWHIGRTLSQYSLLEDQRHFLAQLGDFAAENQVDAVLIAGDIYNRAVPGAQAVELLNEFFSRMVLEHHIRVIAIAGNHDSPERLDFGSRLLERQGLFIAGAPSARLRAVTLGEGETAVTVHLMPYFTPAQVRALLGDESIATFNDAFAALVAYNRPFIDTAHHNILLAHGFFSALGGRGGDDAVFSASELSVGAADVMDITPAAGCFDYAALGHLHAPQRAGEERLRYAGSPLKYSLSEERQQKSVVLLETGKKGGMHLTTKAFPPLRDVRTIAGRFEGLLSPAAGENTQDYVFASIEGSDAVLFAMQKLKAVYPNILGLRFEAMQREPAAVPSGAAARPLEELFGDFYRHVTGEPLSEERLRLAAESAREARQEREVCAV